MEIATKEGFDNAKQLARLQKYDYLESGENSEIIDLLQMDLSVDNISVALNIPEATLTDCNVEKYFIEPVKHMKESIKSFRKDGKYKLKNFFAEIKDFSEKYHSKYNNYLCNFIESKNEEKFGKAVGLVERDLNEVLKTESTLETQINSLSEEFNNIFTQFYTFAQRLKGKLVKKQEELQNLEAKKENNINDSQKCKKEIIVLQTHIEKQRDSLEKLKQIANNLSNDKIDLTEEIEIGKIEAQFCDNEINYHKQDETFLRKEIEALVSKIDAVENEKKTMEKEYGLKLLELVNKKMELLKRNTEKKNKIAENEKTKFGGIIDFGINLVFGVRPIQALKEKVNGNYLDDNIELKGINDEIANFEIAMQQNADYFVSLQKEVKDQLAEKKSKKVKIENNIGQIQQSISNLGKQKSSLEKNEQSKIAAKTKILDRLEKTSQNLEADQKNLELEKEKQKKLEENRGIIENNIKKTEEEIQIFQKYISDLDRLKLPPEFIQMVNNFSVAFNRLNDKLNNFKNFLTKDGKLKLKYDGDEDELEMDDPWKLRIQYKQQIDSCISGLRSSLEQENENEKLLELLN